MSTERILVQKSVSKEFEVELKAAIDRFFPAEASALILVNDRGVSRNRALREDAVSKGASVIHGDIATKEESTTRLRPIVIKGVKEGMDLYYAESFGPTVSLFEFEDEAEALRIGNDTEYGLSSAVFTQSLQRGFRVAKQIETGAVHINDMSVHDEPDLPHGGVKASGWGRFGSLGIDEWLTTKNITFKN
jgi:acyl-CoA reductase-like NAD-dependent aldehyde dehydrogenase